MTTPTPPKLRIFDSASMPWTPHPTVPTLQIKPFENRASGAAYDAVLVIVPPGGRIDWHFHPVSTETVYVVSGTGVIWESESDPPADAALSAPIRAGTVVTIPIALRHAVDNTGDADLHIFAIHAPATI